MAKRKPIRSESVLRQHYEERDIMLNDFLRHRNAVSVPHWVIENIRDRAAKRLIAANGRAQVAFACELHRRLSSYLQNTDGGTYYFVTYAPERWVIKAKNAVNFDIEAARAEIEVLLAGAHFTGMFEIAFYTNCRSLPHQNNAELFSYHYHGLVWATSPRLLDDARRESNRRDKALLPGRDAFHVKPIKGNRDAANVWYMAKGAASEYTIYPERKATTADGEVGESTIEPTGQFIQRKRPLRPRAAWNMQALYADRTIADLTVSGGMGIGICQESRKAARLSIEQEDRQFREHLIRSGIGATLVSR